MPCKRVKLCVYNNQYKPAAFSRKCMCMIFISTFPEKIWWILYCECQRNSADLHYSKGFHPYQSSLVNKGFNMQPDWDSFSCCNKASKQERLILSIKWTQELVYFAYLLKQPCNKLYMSLRYRVSENFPWIVYNFS